MITQKLFFSALIAITVAAMLFGGYLLWNYATDTMEAADKLALLLSGLAGIGFAAWVWTEGSKG